jgi:hypothetical protein
MLSNATLFIDHNEERVSLVEIEERPSIIRFKERPIIKDHIG